ncbi:MAG: glycosyltransferase family 4 protein [Propionibacteriaceae bacterium]
MSASAGRLCLVVQGFPPEPLPIPLTIAQELEQQGWDVTVLTGIPNYPSGKVAPGYRASEFRREVVEGIKVRRTALYASHDHNPIKRFLNYGSWALTATFGGWREIRQAHVVLVYSSPATAALPALVSKILRRKPYVLLIEDLWPDSIFASGFLTQGAIYKVANSLLTRFCAVSYSLSSHIAVISPGMSNVLEARGVPAEKISVVHNWVDESIFKPVTADPSLRKDLGLSDDDFLVMYAGNHGAAQRLDSFIQAMAQTPSHVHAVFIGDGVEKASLQELAKTAAPGRIHFLDPLQLSDMPTLMAAADIQLISLADQELFRITLPSKVQSCLAAGSPILLAAPGDAAKIIEASQAGFVAIPEDVDDIARAICEAAATPANELQNMGIRSYSYYRKHMAAAVGSRQLSDILTSAIKRKKRKR